MAALLSATLVVLQACSSTPSDTSTPPTSSSPGGAPGPTDTPDANGGSTDIDAAPALDGSTGSAPDAGGGIADSGITPVADAAVKAAIDGSLAPSCNALAQAGSPVSLLDVVGSFPEDSLLGGSIPDGRYVLTSATHYVEPSHIDGVLTPYGRETITVAGAALAEHFDHPTGEVLRFTGSLVLTGSRIQLTPGCVESTHPNLPKLYDWDPLVHEKSTYQVTLGTAPTTLTVWTPRGNHEAVVRVYAKIE